MSVRFGATESFDPMSQDAAAEVRRLPRRHRRRCRFAGGSRPKLVPVALNIARPGGRVLLFAQNDPLMQIQFPAAAVGIEEKEILGSYSASVDWQDESARLVFEHQCIVSELISHRFSLNAIGEAFEMASQPAENSLKVVVLP